METKTINPFIVYVAIIVITVVATLQYKNYETKNALKNSCYVDNQMARTLTPFQFTENVKAMIEQNAPTDDLSWYVGCYEKDPDGNYSLKSPR